MALLANGLETLEVGATAWRLIINATISKLYSRTEAETTFVAKAGGVMTNFLTLHANPTSALHAATKQYVDNSSANATYSTLVETLVSDTIPNFGLYANFSYTLNTSPNFYNPSTHQVGRSGKIIFKQDVNGNKNITWGSYYKFVGGVKATLTQSPNAIDCFDYFVLSATEILITSTEKAMA